MEKPVPIILAESRPFWEGCDRGELLFQYCKRCERAQYYPRMLCVHCHSGELEWRVSAGQGTVHSYTEVFRAPNEAFKADAPYMIVVVDLDEGFRMVANLLAPTDGLRIGSNVTVAFEARGDRMIPQFKLSE